MSYPCRDCGTVVEPPGIYPQEPGGLIHDSDRCMSLVKAQLTRSEARCKRLEPVVQVAVDWCNDTGGCLFCSMGPEADQPHEHNEECPVWEYIGAEARAAK